MKDILLNALILYVFSFQLHEKIDLIDKIAVSGYILGLLLEREGVYEAKSMKDFKCAFGWLLIVWSIARGGRVGSI